MCDETHCRNLSETTHRAVPSAGHARARSVAAALQRRHERAQHKVHVAERVARVHVPQVAWQRAPSIERVPRTKASAIIDTRTGLLRVGAFLETYLELSTATERLHAATGTAHEKPLLKNDTRGSASCGRALAL